MGRSDFGSEHVVGAESGIDGDQLLKAANDEGAEKNDDDGNGNFAGYENGAAAMIVTAAAITGAKDVDQWTRMFGPPAEVQTEVR